MYALRLSLAAIGAELADFRNRLSAVQAKLGFCASSHRTARSGRTTFGAGTRTSLLDGVHHGLSHGHACTEASADSRCTSAFVRSRHRNRLRDLVLGVSSH